MSRFVGSTTALLVLALGLGCGVREACAAWDGLVEVAQPMYLGENGEFEIHRVTYVYTSGSGERPGLAIDHTCERNAVLARRGRASAPDSEYAEDWNEAYLWELKVKTSPGSGSWYDLTFVPHPRGTDHKEGWEGEPGFLVLDTLRVSLDVSGGVDRARAEDHRALPNGAQQRLSAWGQKHLDRLVESTVRCIRMNAATSHTPIRTLALRIVGSRRYAMLARSYTIWQPPPLPARKR